jgi:hypothetical protein
MQTMATQAACTQASSNLNQATGPSTTKSVPLKIIKSGENTTYRRKQMERWLEHYLELYSTQNVVTDAALSVIKQLPVLNELDEKPTKEELSKAIDCLAITKAPGEDGIPPEVIKTGKEELIEDLHELFCLCWRAGHARRQDSDTLQKQRRPKRLQQLPGYFPF